MKFYISKNLQQFISQILQKKQISTKDFLKLNAVISIDNRWIKLSGYLFLGILIYLSFTFAIEKMGITNSLYFKIPFAVSVMIVSELIIYTTKLVLLYKTLQKGGIIITELSKIQESIFEPSFYAYKSLKLTDLLFPPKTQEIFEQNVGDWQEEYTIAKIDNKRMKVWVINIRYIYSFIIILLQKSLIGSLVEFVIKIAKP